MATEDKKILLDISINADQFINKIVQAKDKIALLKKENQQLNVDAKAALEGGLLDAYDQLTRKIAENENQSKIARTELSRSQSQYQSYTLAVKANAGSYEQVYQQWKLAEVVLKNLEGTLQRNAEGVIELTDEYKRAKAETENAKNALLAFGEGIKDGRLNVGNYAASVEGVLSKFPIFSEGLGTIREGLNGLKTGFEVANEGRKLFLQGIDDLKASVLALPGQFKEGFKSIKDSVSGLKGDLQQTTEAGKGVAAVGTAGRAAGAGLNVGANAAKLFRLALISTGIGALVVAVGSLIAFFASTEKGANLVKVAFAGIGAVVEVIIGAFASLGEIMISAFQNPRKVLTDLVDFIKGTLIENLKGVYNVLVGLATVDFKQVKEGLGNIETAGSNLIGAYQKAGTAISDFGNKLKDAALASAQLKQEEIALEKSLEDSRLAIARQNIQVEKLISISKDRTKTEAERVAASQEAYRLEQERIALEISNAQKREALLKREIELKKTAGTNVKEEITKLKELQIETANIASQGEKRLVEIKTEGQNTIRELRLNALNAEKSILDAQIREETIAGNNTLSLKIRQAEIERDSLLQQENLSGQQRIAIRAQFRAKILELENEDGQLRLSLSDRIRDIEISRIIDGQTREIEAEKEALQRKLRDIKGNSDEEIRLREQITIEGLEKINAIVTKYEEISLQKKGEILNQSVANEQRLIEEEATKRLGLIEVQSIKELGILEAQLEAGEITRQTFEQRQRDFELQKFAVQEEALVQEVELQAKYKAIREVQEAEFYASQTERLKQSLDQKQITESEYILQKAELDRIAKENAGKTEIETQTALNEAIAKLEDLRLKKTIDTEKAIVKAKLDSVKMQREVNKALLENSVKLSEDLQALLSEDEKAKKKNAKAIKALASVSVVLNLEKEVSNLWTSASETASKTGIYGAIAAYALAGIQTALAAARTTSALSRINSQNYEKGGLSGGGEKMPLSKTIQKYNPKFVPDFQGGMVSSPTLWKGAGALNLAGEKSTEYVAPPWQLSQAPGLFQDLEIWRRTGVRPFADGGFTSMQFSGAGMNADALEQSFMKVMANMPPSIVTVEDFNKVQNRINVVESRSSL